MPERTPIARGPIDPAPPEAVVAGWAVSGRCGAAALVITDCSPLAKVAVKAAAAGGAAGRMGVPCGSSRRQSWVIGDRPVSVLVVGAGPGEWLVLAPPDTQHAVTDSVSSRVASTADELVSVVDLTHGRALVRLTGDRSAELLAKETAVDLSDTNCPDGSALRTAVAGLAADVVRNDQNGVASYLVHCERSSGQYLFDSLLDAGDEFDIDIDGFVARPGP